MSRFQNYTGSSIPLVIRTERQYQAPVVSLGSYFFMPGFEDTGSVPGDETYWFYDKQTETFKRYHFDAAEIPDSITLVHDTRGFLDLGSGHYFVCLRQEQLYSPSSNYGIIVESSNYGETWTVRHSMFDWTGGLPPGSRALDIRDLRLGNDGLVYGAFSTWLSGGILRFDPSNTDPLEWCMATSPFGGSVSRVYGICQDSLDRWYMNCVEVDVLSNPIITRMSFVASTTQANDPIWTSAGQDYSNDEAYGLQRNIRPMAYSSVTDTLWIPTREALMMYDVTGDTTSEYLISTNFRTDFTTSECSYIQLDSNGDPEWIAAEVSDGSTFIYFVMLNRTSSNLYTCYLFDDSFEGGLG